MTTPGGVPNLPVGALTMDTLASKLQDTSVAAMRNRAGERMPGIFNGSNGGNPLADLSPFGILTQLWAGFNSLVANADPADIQGPEDLPGLLIDFIDDLPVVGQFIDLMEAISGNYTGTDQVLVDIQNIFAPIRELLNLVAGAVGSFPPSVEDITNGWHNTILTLEAILDWLHDLIFGGGSGGGSGFPYGFPVPFGGEADNPVALWFANVRAFLHMDFSLPDFDLQVAVQQFIANILQPLEMLAPMVGGVIPPFHIPTLDPSHVLDLPAALSNLQATWDGMVRGWFGDSSAVGSVADVEVILGAARQVWYGLITVADLANSPKNVPIWVSINPFHDVSFPRSQLESVASYSGGTTGDTAQFGDGNPHNHTFSISPTTVRPLYSIPAGTMVLSAVRITQDRLVNVTQFLAGGGAPPTHLYVGLYQLDPVTGARTLIYDFGDAADDVDTGSLLYECTLEMTADMLIDAGALLEVGILPVGASFAVAGVPRSPIVPTTVLHPQSATELLSGLSALPSSIADSSLDHGSTHRVWVSIGQAVPETITPVTMIVDFDAYAATENWVSPAVHNFGNGSWAIYDGKLSCSGPPTLGPSNYQRAFVPLQRCATDNHYAEMVIGGGWTGEPVGARDNALVRCSADGTAGVSMLVQQQGAGNATVRIETITDILALGTVRATSSGVFQALPGDIFRIEAVHNEDDGYTTFTCYRNGVAIPGAVWADTGDVAPRGVAWRRPGFAATAASYSLVVHKAAPVDVWRAGDLT